VKFKLEVAIEEQALKEIAEASRQASGADFIVANLLEMVDGQRPGAWLIGPNTAEWIERNRLAARLAEIVKTSRT
jgi:hypothetical protein